MQNDKILINNNLATDAFIVKEDSSQRQVCLDEYKKLLKPLEN